MPTIVTPATIAKIKPPKAPAGGYEVGNEDFFRNLVAKLLKDFASDINTNGGTGTGGVSGGTFAGPFPASPVFGEAHTVGDSTHPARIQLKNPIGSGVNLMVYEMYLSNTIITTGTGLLLGVRTASPTTMTGISDTANLIHLDEDNVSTIHATLVAGPNGSALTEATADFAATSTAEGQAAFKTYPIRSPAGFAIKVDPGSAIEFTTTVNGTGDGFRLWAVWDEVTIV